MAAKPAAGKITSEKTISEVGVTELNFANGVRVFLKPTDFKNDEILFTSWKMGGLSLTSDADYQSGDMSNAIVEESGLGEFDKISLDKYMQGKIANVHTALGDLSSGLEGSCSPQDLETALQLMNLYCTAPRNDETAFKSLMEQQKGFLQNRLSDPGNIFRDTVNYTMSNYNWRARPMTVEILKEVNPSKAFDIYKQRFGNANGWTFTFVGNFKVDEMKNMLSSYLGSLPSTSEKESFKA
jgi:zinc protease